MVDHAGLKRQGLRPAGEGQNVTMDQVVASESGAREYTMAKRLCGTSTVCRKRSPTRMWRAQGRS